GGLHLEARARVIARQPSPLYGGRHFESGRDEPADLRVCLHIWDSFLCEASGIVPVESLAAFAFAKIGPRLLRPRRGGAIARCASPPYADRVSTRRELAQVCPSSTRKLGKSCATTPCRILLTRRQRF